jgi:uncharacterized protein YgiM (DUF1202 family)
LDASGTVDPQQIVRHERRTIGRTSVHRRQGVSAPNPPIKIAEKIAANVAKRTERTGRYGCSYSEMAIAYVRKVIDVETGTESVGLGKQMTRRGMLRLMGGLGAAAVASVVLTRVAGATSGSAYFRTTSALNLRAKASTSGKVLLVLPANAQVKNLGQSSNGFFKVTYQGTTGWAFSDYLVSDVPDVDVNWIGDAKTTSAVNFRSDPSSSADVMAVIAKGKTVTISDVVENGYRYVEAQGALGWIFDDYLAPVEESGPVSFKTTTSVNLRANPSTSAKVLKVVPAGKTVVDYDLVMSNGYRGVDYNGTVGWIYDDYLQKQ